MTLFMSLISNFKMQQSGASNASVYSLSARIAEDWLRLRGCNARAQQESPLFARPVFLFSCLKGHFHNFVLARARMI